VIPPLPQRTRRAALTAHIVVSVGLLGDSAGFLAIAVRAAATTNADLARSSYELLKMFSLVFGIPLSFSALSTGFILGLGTKWGVFRYPWVTAKLLLIVSVIFVGAFVLGPAVDAMRAAGGNAEAKLIAGAAYDVAALTVATSLGSTSPAAAENVVGGRALGDEFGLPLRSKKSHDSRRSFMRGLRQRTALALAAGY